MKKSTLEAMLYNKKPDEKRMEFLRVARSNPNKAVLLINESATTFITFLMLDDIVKTLPLSELSDRCQKTMRICNECMCENCSRHCNGDDENTLLWMTHDCLSYDGANDDYDRIMDYCLGRLVCEFKNKEALDNAVKLLFLRYEKNEFYHDLVWEIFKSDTPLAVEAISEHMEKGTEKEKALCEEILDTLIDDDPEDNSSISKHINNWVRDNEPYIEFMNNSFNSSSCPQFCKVNYYRKYCGCPCFQCGFYLPVNDTDSNYENSFCHMDNRRQAALAKKSCEMRKRDMGAWCRWKSRNAYLDLTDSDDIWEV